MTAQLLGYVRKEKHDTTAVDLNELLKETSDIFARARKEFVIQKELSGGLHHIEAERGQIEQVLMNLYINAIDAMPGGGILSLMTKNTTHKEIQGKLCHPRPGDYVLIKVSDTGTGMGVKTMKRIFDPFFTTKGTGQGTGLGLTSVYAIVEGHGGYIDVESEVGCGTVFNIYLPASKALAPDQMTHFEKGEIIFGTEGVLLVDDEAEIRKVGGEMLETLGYRVLMAGDGEEAVRVFKDHQNDIDIVLLDMVMPKIGGGEVYDRLKRINRDIIVLLVSGYSDDGEAGEILKRGCDGFIQKPFMIDELSQSLRTLLEKRGTGEKVQIICTAHDQTIHVD